MKFLFLIVLIPAFATAVSFERNGESLTMSGSSCRVLEKEVSEISEWSDSRETPSCSCEKTQCKVEITSILPPTAQKNLLTRPAFDGPNCWNSALVSVGILKELRYTSPQELGFWLKTCEKKISPDPGDIVSIRAANGEEIHSYIYVSKSWGFSKNGQNWYADYNLQPHKEITDKYKSSSDMTVSFYSCQSQELPEGRLSELEKRISLLAMKGRIENDVELKALQAELTEIFLGSVEGSADYFRANSLASQVETLLFRYYSVY